MIYSLSGKAQTFNNSIDDCSKRILGENVHNSIRYHRWMIFRLISVALFYLVGGIYYHTQEGWSPIDCIFFMTVSVATVGYGDFYPTSDHSRLFTAFFILYGLLFVLTAVDDFARYVAVPSQSYLINIHYSLDTKAERCSKKIFMSVSTMLFLMVLGVIVYEYNEDWTSAQAFYFTIVTMATVGYGDLIIEKISTRVFTIFFIWTCLVTYATLIQNVREMYLLALSVPASDRDSSGAMMRVTDGDAEGDSSKHIELSPTSSSGNPMFSGLQKPVTGNVDVVACLVALLQQESAQNLSAQQAGTLRADLDQIRAKYNFEGVMCNMSKQSVVDFVSRFESTTANSSTTSASKSREEHQVKYGIRSGTSSVQPAATSPRTPSAANNKSNTRQPEEEDDDDQTADNGALISKV